MPNFELIRLDLDCKLYPFYKLVKNGRCELDDFEANLESNQLDDLERIYTIMEEVGSSPNLLPKTMFRPLKNKHPDAFEVKSGNLRVYGMHLKKTGKIIVLCGNKGSQAEDLNTLPKRIKEFINHLKNQENGKKKSNKK